MNQSIQQKFPHYYGDIVRWLFMIAAILMLLTLPTFSDILNIPIIVSVASILVLGLAAGLTNPKQIWDATINTAIAATGFLLFETVAVWAYRQNFGTTQGERFFMTNIGLGFIFLIAIYFSVKTLRGLLLKEEVNKIINP